MEKHELTSKLNRCMKTIKWSTRRNACKYRVKSICLWQIFLLKLCGGQVTQGMQEKNRVRNSKSKWDGTPDGWGMRMVSATVIWFIVQKCKRNAEHFEAIQIKRVCVWWSVSVDKHGKNVSKIASKTIKLADSRDELNQCTCLLHAMGSAIYRTHFSIDNEALQIEIEIYCTYKMSLVF